MSGRNISAIAGREFRGYFDQATAYILLVAFLVANFFFFFRTVLATGEASLRPMFALMPWLLLFFVPAITMRSIAEDRAHGTLELVLSQPIRDVEYLLGKFLGLFAFVTVALLCSLAAWFAIDAGGDPHAGPAFAQYVGSLLMAASLVAIGLWASATTRNQITAFILGAAVSFVFMALNLPLVLQGLPPAAATVAQRLGMLTHYNSITRGVLDLRDVVYFVAVTVAFLGLGYLLLARGRRNPSGQRYRKLQAGAWGIVLCCVAVNLVGQQIRGRWDLTPGGAFTLAEPTRALLEGLEDVVTIRFFASRDLPSQAELIKRDTEDLLADYDAVGGGQVILEKIEDVDESVAEELGILPVEFRVLGEDEFQARQGYLGIALQYADGLETVPWVERSEDLEYRLTSAIQRMIEPSKDGVGFLGGFGGPDHETELAGLVTHLASAFTVETVDLWDDAATIPDSVSVLIVPAPTEQLTESAGDKLRGFVARGGNVLLSYQQYDISETTMFADTTSHPVLDAFLADYGVRVAEGAAYDMRSNFPLTLTTGTGQTIQRPYPLWPVALPVSSHPAVAGLNGVVLGWVSPLDLSGADTTTVTPLLATTQFGGIFTGPFPLDPTFDWQRVVSDPRPSPVAAAVLPRTTTGGGGRIILVGDAEFMTNRFLAANQDNLSFLRNAIDWLARDESLIGIRSKDRQPPTLLYSSVQDRDTARYACLVGLPLLLVILGFLRLMRRRRLSTLTWDDRNA